MRFLDDLIRAGLPWRDEFPAINADNVARYAFEDMSDSINAKYMKDVFPNLAPPFYRAAIEWCNPLFFGNGKNIAMSVSGRNIVLFYCLEVNNPEFLKTRESVRKNWELVRGLGARWFILMTLCTDRWFPVVGLHTTLAMSIGIDGTGQIVGCGGDDHPWALYWSTTPGLGGDLAAAPKIALSAMFFPALFTLSFMNCKNVVVRDQSNPPRLIRRHVKLYGRAPIIYKTLEIQPMQKILRETAAAHGVGVVQAMHICRGHFKDYREHGLFGRNKGIYFWGQNVRGTLAAGLVKKDYQVFPPNGKVGGKEQ